MNKRRAMVVDDYPSNCLLAAALLERLGWRVTEANSGEAALDAANAEQFELVLLDISMPGLSGEETCKRLREGSNGNKMRILAYTAHAYPEEKARFLAAGFDDILVKPIDRPAFEALIGQV